MINTNEEESGLPLVLDLNGDGIETVGISATTHILFDHNNDGITTGKGWGSKGRMRFISLLTLNVTQGLTQKMRIYSHFP